MNHTMQCTVKNAHVNNARSMDRQHISHYIKVINHVKKPSVYGKKYKPLNQKSDKIFYNLQA
jgi:hypothetical protein